MAEAKEPSQRDLVWAKAVWDVMGDHGGRPWCGDCNEDPECADCIRMLLPDMGPVLSLAKAEREKAARVALAAAVDRIEAQVEDRITNKPPTPLSEDEQKGWRLGMGYAVILVRGPEEVTGG